MYSSRRPRAHGAVHDTLRKGCRRCRAACCRGGARGRGVDIRGVNVFRVDIAKRRGRHRKRGDRGYRLGSVLVRYRHGKVERASACVRPVGEDRVLPHAEHDDVGGEEDEDDERCTDDDLQSFESHGGHQDGS